MTEPRAVVHQKRAREKEVQSSITSMVPFLTVSGRGPKTHFLTSAERKSLQSIKGNAGRTLQELGWCGEGLMDCHFPWYRLSEQLDSIDSGIHVWDLNQLTSI